MIKWKRKYDTRLNDKICYLASSDNLITEAESKAHAIRVKKWLQETNTGYMFDEYLVFINNEKDEIMFKLKWA